MTRQYFGTDGVRGTANQWPMTAEIALRLGMAAGHRFTNGGHRHTVLIGKDTRLSGYMLEPALVAGFTSVGMDVVLVGPIPTPAVAMLTRSLRADLGVMISASHNPYQDNGIKLFGPDGYKLSDEVELEIEAMIDTLPASALSSSARLGRARRMEDAAGRYIESVKQSFPRGRRLDGLKVAVDCANGAAYKTAPAVLWELGAEVVPVGITPNGTNINRDCGSQASRLLQETVVTHGCHVGLALDGDADRLVVVDDRGTLVDGDQVLGLIAGMWQRRGELAGSAVVATVMSNMGLEKYLRGQGVQLERTAVGDRYVVEKMRADGLTLGGEQSGHIIVGTHATTGDGLLAGLQVLAELIDSGKPASEVLTVFKPFPQLLKNVRVADAATATRLMSDASVERAQAAAEAAFGETGRVLLRKSGTEPLIRVMAEGENLAQVEAVVADLVRAVELAV